MSDHESSSIRVLVVDDEDAICRIVTQVLIRNGFVAESVSDQASVEEVLERSVYEVVLLDRSLGSVAGSHLLPLLREKLPAAKILYFTGDFVEPDEEALVDGVVMKPVNGRELTRALLDVL